MLFGLWLKKTSVKVCVNFSDDELGEMGISVI